MTETRQDTALLEDAGQPTQGNRIKEQMEKQDVSISELAEFLGVSRNAVKYWRKNQNQPPLIKMYVIAAFLKCCIHDLIIKSPKPEDEPKEDV